MRADYKKILKEELENLDKLFLKIKDAFTIKTLQDLKKGVEHLEYSAKNCQFTDIIHLCHPLLVDLDTTVQNLHLRPTKPEAMLDEVSTFLKNSKEALSKHQEKEQNMATVAEKKSIAVVDDDEDLLKLLDYELRQLGLDVVTFKTG
jgi:hypothetical protein